MAEESDLEKTEPGSPRRLEKAREEGEVARSRELTTFVLLATGMGGLWLNAAPMNQHIGRALQRGLQFERASAFDSSHMMVQAGNVVMEALQA
ncbi:MAG: EscU/YscU/HrcU family type III secretion system export apparatus switch protein, partial [Oxalobacteraceae bacterium]